MADQSPNDAKSPVIAALRQALGAEAVTDAPDQLDHVARTTSPPAARPLAIARPTDTAQVQQVVRIAGEHRVPVYPISRGCNWGYGDACPPTDGQILLDLGRMNRIIEVNEASAYAVIEPGVSQRQLYDYLCAHHPDLWMDATGAGLEASFVGNTLDRGFGHTRYGDHFLTCCGMDIVLADGSLLKTGYGHYPDARADRIYRYGVGPFLDGLFCQSNYGIITRIGLWLTPRPEAFCCFFFYCDRPGQLPDMIDRLAPLRLQSMLTSTIHIGNDLRVLSARMRYPWDQAGGQTPLPDELRAKLARQTGIGAWNGGGAIYGTAGTVRSIKRKVRKVLKPYHVRFVDDRALGLARWTHRQLKRLGMGRRLGELLDVLEPVYGLMKGVPSDEPLKGSGWRVREPMPQQAVDPRAEPTGLRWVSPVLPTTGTAAEDMLAIAEPLYRKHGFEALITFTMITERAMIAVTNLSFDQREPDEAAAAKACYDELMAALLEAGFVPYRTGPGGFEKLYDPDDVFWQTAQKIKQALDPDQIIAPGRYLPQPDAPRS